MQADKLEEAIYIFKLTVDLFPESSNAFDSLAEAYLNAGNKELATRYYEQSVRLDPENANGAAALKKLRH